MIVTKEIMFSASKSAVWDLLTNPQKTKQYMFGCEVLSSWEVGAPIIWKGLTEAGAEIIYVKGEILQIHLPSFRTRIMAIQTVSFQKG